MNSLKTISTQRVKCCLMLVVIVSTTTFLLAAAEPLRLDRGKPRQKPAPIIFTTPKESVELPGPDQLEAPQPRSWNSLKPNTSQEGFGAPYLPGRRETPRRLPELQKDWLFGPTPTSQKEKDEEINKFFGIRESSRDQIEKGSKTSRADWLVENSAQRRQPQPPRNKPRSDGSDSDSERKERQAGGDRREDGFRAANRSEPLYKSLFDSATSANGDSGIMPSAFGQSSMSFRDMVGTGANTLRDREAQTKLEEFRKLLDPRPASSAFGTSEPLATGLDSARPAPLTPLTVPNFGGTENDQRRAGLDPKEFSGSASRYRAPLFGDLNRRQFGISESSSEVKPKTESANSWVRPPVLEIPRRKF